MTSSSNRVLHGVIGLAGVAVIVSTLAVSGMVLTAGKPPVFLLGFEAMILAAGILGLLTGIGRFAGARSMTLLCVASVIGVGSLLAYISSGNSLGGLKHAYLIGRLALAGLMCVLAAWFVLARRPQQSLACLVRGVLASLGFVGLIAGIWYGSGVLAGLGSLMSTLVLVFAAIAALGLLAAGTHFTIQAFEFGRVADSEQISPQA